MARAPPARSAWIVMGYFDGTTVTDLWNYAHSFAMSNNSYGTTFGPSTPGLLNLAAGQANGVTATLNGTGNEVSGDSDDSLTVIGDPDPIGEVRSNPNRNQVTMDIGDLWSAAGATWESFMGGFDLTVVNSNGSTVCSRSSAAIDGVFTNDYIRITRSSTITLPPRIRRTRGPLRLPR